MSHLTYAEAVVVGLIQGVTELFPVSSLGHNVLIPALIGGQWAQDLNVSKPESPYLAFIVGLHVATALAMIIYFWRDWLRIIGGFFSSLRERQVATADQRLAWIIILATIPVGIAGLALEHLFRVVFSKPVPTALFLAVNGLILLSAERQRRRSADVRAATWDGGVGMQPPQSMYPPRSGYPAPGAHPVQAGYPAQAGYSTQPGYSAQGNYPAQPGYSAQSKYPAQGAYPSQGAYPAQAGYSAQGAYPARGGYQAPGADTPGGGYPPQAGYSPQGGYSPQAGFSPQGGYTQAGGYSPQGPYPAPAGSAGYPAGGGYRVPGAHHAGPHAGRQQETEREQETARAVAADRRLSTMGYGRAILIGAAQVLALLPGISRDGIVTVIGMTRGLSREDAVRYSFLLSAPVILAAGVLKIPDLFGPLGAGIHGQVLVASLLSGIGAYLSIRYLVRYFSKARTLTPFAIYCLVAGLGSLAYFVIR